MHCNATDRYREALRRLAVVLLALAGIAERATCRSWPVRPLLLWLLSRAETRARNFAGRTGGLPLSAEYAFCRLSGTGDAERLAKAFRALAVYFFALACRAPQCLRMARRLRRLPAWRKRPTHNNVHEILKQVHGLGSWARDGPGVKLAL
jgi:hypothetical protein